VKPLCRIGKALFAAAVVTVRCSAADAPVIPQKLDIYIGNAVLGAWHVRLHERSLMCTLEANGKLDRSGPSVTPSDEQWRAFRATLDRLHIARWQHDYPNPGGVEDGTQWHIQIVYPDAAVDLRGDNNFPAANGKANADSKWTPTFREFVTSVRTLLGAACCFSKDL
jgi:hypothetical protein